MTQDCFPQVRRFYLAHLDNPPAPRPSLFNFPLRPSQFLTVGRRALPSRRKFRLLFWITEDGGTSQVISARIYAARIFDASIASSIRVSPANAEFVTRFGRPPQTTGRFTQRSKNELWLRPFPLRNSFQAARRAQHFQSPTIRRRMVPRWPPNFFTSPRLCGQVRHLSHLLGCQRLKKIRLGSDLVVGQ